MGMISTESLAAHNHRHPDRFAGLHGASGPRPGGDSARRAWPMARVTTTRSPGRGWSAFGIAMVFMSIAALVMITVPHLLISAFLDLRGIRIMRASSRSPPSPFLAMAAIFQIVDGAAGRGGGNAAGIAGYAHPDALCRLRLLARPACRSRSDSGSTRRSPVSASGWGSPAGSPWSQSFLMWRWRRRDRLGLLPRLRGG